MSRPIDLPFTEHFQMMPCGTRAKYVAGGCRCVPCRAAASRYESERLAARKRGEWNGLVDVEPVRRHLLKLSKQGVGYKTVAVAASVSKTSLAKVLNGRKTHMRKQGADRVLAVTKDAVADNALVPAAATHRRIAALLEEGFTKRELARRLGSKARVPALQLKGDFITALNASKVERLYRTVML